MKGSINFRGGSTPYAVGTVDPITQLCPKRRKIGEHGVAGKQVLANEWKSTASISKGRNRRRETCEEEVAKKKEKHDSADIQTGKRN